MSRDSSQKTFSDDKPHCAISQWVNVRPRKCSTRRHRVSLRFRSTESRNPRSWVSLIVIILGLLTGSAHGQQPTETHSIAAEAAEPAPLPLVELPSESEATAARVRDIRGNLSSDRSAETVAQQLPKISREIDGRLPKAAKFSRKRHRSKCSEALKASGDAYGANCMA